MKNSPWDRDSWQAKPINVPNWDRPAGFHDVYENKIQLIDEKKAQDVYDRAREALFSYRIYPPSRMEARICSSNGRIQLGATIIQKIKVAGISLFSGVRVIQVMNPDKGANIVGFSYATLQGHPEKGVIRFSVEKETSSITIKIESWSRPNHWILNLVRPFVRALQKQSNRQALQHIQEVAGGRT